MGRSSEVILLTVLAVVMLGVKTGFAIHCFVCNSQPDLEGEECLNLTPAQWNTSQYYKNCDAKLLPALGRLPYERCALLVETANGDPRIVRYCDTWPDKTQPNGCDDRIGIYNIKMRYCKCAEDGCNGSPSLYASFLVISAVVGAGALLR